MSMFLAALLVASTGTPSTPAPSTGITIGPTLHRFQDDFGFGLAVGSPTFLHDTLRVTLGGGLAYYPYAADADGEQTWERYGTVRLVLEGGHRAPGSPVRVYGFGGPIVHLVPDSLDDDAVAIGGIGGFGFEYFFQYDGHDGPVSYFVELGGVGGAFRADAQPGRPVIGNGFVATVGFRWEP